MNPLLVPLVFVIVLIAELPDKTMFATLLLGTRFPPRWVFLGAASAFVVHVVIAVAAGSALSLLPKNVLDYVVTALFLVGAAFLFRESRKPDEDEDDAAAARESRTPFGASLAAFGVIFVGEWGDITQIATANLAAKYDDPLAVGIGAVLGLWTAALIALYAGRLLLRYVSTVWLHRVGTVIFLALAVYSLVEAINAG